MPHTEEMLSGGKQGKQKKQKKTIREPGGQSSPGSLHEMQKPSKGMRQIAQQSSATSHFQSATPCHFFTLTFIPEDAGVLSAEISEDSAMVDPQ
jgi:hypothetical protein